MAKNIGKLAGLAALAGAAYMMRDKFGKDATGPAATAAEKDASEARTKAQRDAISGNKSAGTQLKTPAESIADADKSDKSSSISTKGAAGTTTPGPDTSEPNLDVKPTPKSAAVTPSVVETKSLKPVSEPSDKSIKLAPKKRDLEAGMSRGTRTPAKPVSTVSSSAEGMTNYKPRRTPAAPSTAKSTVSSSAEGMKNYKPRSTSAAPATTTTKVTEKPTEKSKNMLEAAKEEARRRAAASQTTRTSTSSSTSPATRTPFPGSSALNKKRGGAVKMASGGMTASRRADGIASRGKTRCKMY